MQTPSLLLDRQNRRNGNGAFGAGRSNRFERDDDDGLRVAGQKRSFSGFAAEADDDDNGRGQSREEKRFKRSPFTFQYPSGDDRDELRRAMFLRGRSRFGGGSDGKFGSHSTFATAAAPFSPPTKTTMGSSVSSSGVKGSSGLVPRTSHPPSFASGSPRNTGTMAQGNTPGFPFILDTSSSSSSDEDEVEEVKVEGDEFSTSLRSSLAFPHAGKKTTGLFQGSSKDVVGQEGLRGDEFRRKEDQRIESERLRRDALVRRKEGTEEGGSRVGFGGLGGVKEEEEEDGKMEDEKDVKMEEENRVVVDRSGRNAEVITLSDSDDEDDVISVAQTSSRSSSMAGLPDGNTSTLNDGTKPHQGNHAAKDLLFYAEEQVRRRPESAPLETPNTSQNQVQEFPSPKNTTVSACPSHSVPREPTVLPPPSKPSSLQDATERIRQERLENAKRMWEGTQARAQAEAEKARRREADARAEDVHPNSVYSDSTPDLLERPTRPPLPSGNDMSDAKSRKMHKDAGEETRQGMMYSTKGEEESPLRAADAEAKKKTSDEQAMQREPQKENIRRESLIEQPAANKPSIEDLARQRKDRQAALVREAEQKLALEAAKKAENDKQMAAYRNSVNSRVADTSVHSKPLSDAETDRNRGRGFQTPLERNERSREAAEGEKQGVSMRRIENQLNTGAENAQQGIRHPPGGSLSSTRPSLGGAFRNDGRQGKKDGPMSLGSFADLQGLKATKVPEVPLRAYGQTASTSAVNPQGPCHQPTSLKAIAEQGGTITSVEPAPTESPQPQSFKKSHVPRIDILPEDIKLLFWRDAGNEWQDIIEDYEEATGKRKSEDTLRKRYRQVKEALSGVEASKDLLARVGTGDVEAKRELDAMIPHAVGDAGKRPNVETKPGIMAPGKDQLGELTPQDIRLLVSRGKGMVWSQIVQDFAISTGENVSEALLRVRYKLVKAAIEKSKVDAPLLTQVMAGDDAARERLNRLVHGVWPVPRVETDAKVERLSKGSSHDRRLGHISAEDIKLVRWKEEGMSGTEMVEALRQAAGRSVSLSTVHKRCRQVMKALDAAGVYAERGLLDLVENGDQEACSRLNQLIHSTVTASHVGEILPEDAMMVREKQRGATYENIVSTYRRSTGRNRSFSWVYERCKSVKALLDPVDIDTHLLESVASADQEARKRLNILVHGKWPLCASTSSTGSSENSAGRVEPPFRTRNTFPESTSHTQKQGSYMGSTYSSSYGSREDQNVSTPPTSPGSIVPQPTVQESRPTTAGKQMNEAAFRYYLEEIREERLREEDSDTDAEEIEEENAFSPEDFCHFIYQVERRELTNSEEDITIDEKNWIAYSEPLTDRLKATAIASKQALVAHDPQLNDAIYADNDWSLTRQNLNTAILYTLDSPAGTVQVRVQQYQRSFQEQIRPSDSVAWVNRTTYTIMQRRIETARSTETVTVAEKEFDPVFDEEDDVMTEKEVNSVHETHTEKIIGDFVYTTPDLANDAAMRHFVAKTYHPRTINLTIRDLERADLIKGFKAKYEGHGEEDVRLFREIVEEDGNSLEVWVQETRLKGPRNV